MLTGAFDEKSGEALLSMVKGTLTQSLGNNDVCPALTTHTGTLLGGRAKWDIGERNESQDDGEFNEEIFLQVAPYAKTLED